MEQNIISDSSKVYISKSNVQGKGVFAACDIKKGELVGVCDVIRIQKDSITNDIEKYIYPFHRRYNQKCICLGFGSFFNHSEKPNCVLSKLDRDDLLMQFTATKNIKKDTEILITYANF